MEVIMLDTAFLRSLGIREEMLPPPPESHAGGTGGNLPPALPTAGPRGVPAELLTLSDVELEKLLKEKHTQEKPYVYLMPNGIHRAAVYPNKVLGEYDVEWPAKEFINLLALARDPDLEGMLAYKPKHGPWYSVDPNSSQEIKDLLLRLDNDDRGITTIQSEKRS
jgi:hypothetical protein